MAVDKLVDSTQLDADLLSVANAIRTKGETTASLAFPSGFISAINAIPTDNGGTVERSDVNFYDYDGTLLHSFTTAEVNESGFALPSNPTHTGLSAQGWNWTLAEIKTQLTAMPTQPVNVGQMYVTDDGKTRIYIHLEGGRLHPYLGICPNGVVIVDWGDGSATASLMGSDLSVVQSADHQYASGGDYVITLTAVEGSFAFSGVFNTAYILRRASNNTSSDDNDVYLIAIRKVEIGTGAVIGTHAFHYCYRLSTITIPNTLSDIGSFAFNQCFMLRSVTMPSNATSVNENTFDGCISIIAISVPSSITSILTSAFAGCRSCTPITIPHGLQSIEANAFYQSSAFTSLVIPSAVTSIGASAFYNIVSLQSVVIQSNLTGLGKSTFDYCTSLAYVTLPDTMTTISERLFYHCRSLTAMTIPSGIRSIGNYAFNSCSSLSKITIPSSVTTIGTYAFSGCRGLGEIHFQSTTPPTVSASNAWSGIRNDCKIYVPTGSLSAYTSASNYPSSSTFTYIEE